MKKKCRYGWKPDLPSPKDHLFKLTAPVGPLPFVDITKTPGVVLPSMKNQGNLGCCTGFGIGDYMEFLVMNKHAQNPCSEQMPFSQLFIYYNERVTEGSVSSDSGAQIRDGIDAVAHLGVCVEQKWPYSDGSSKFRRKPTKTAYADALKFKAVERKRVDNTDKAAVVQTLVEGFPLVFGFTVFESFESDPEVEKTGIVPMPGPNESILGGHCVTLWGYDPATDRYKCKNSWGPDWGDKGWFYLPAGIVNNNQMADDFWRINTIL